MEEIHHEKLLTLMIAAVLLLGCVNVTAYADDAHKGTTTIKATVAAVAYEIVIPSSVDMTAPGVLEVAEPSVKNVSNAIDKTVISYTATGTDFTRSGGSGTMTAAYYSDLAGTTPFPTEAVEVYKNKALVSPLKKIYVGVTEEDWYAATPGTYTATITFDFNAENKTKPATLTIAQILDTVPGDFPIGYVNGWRSPEKPDYRAYLSGTNNDQLQISMDWKPLTSIATAIDAGYRYVLWSDEDREMYWDFVMTNGVLTSIVYNDIDKRRGTDTYIYEIKPIAN